MFLCLANARQCPGDDGHGHGTHPTNLEVFQSEWRCRAIEPVRESETNRGVVKLSRAVQNAGTHELSASCCVVVLWSWCVLVLSRVLCCGFARSAFWSCLVVPQFDLTYFGYALT